jgi:preprotein translocase subunit SecE
MQDKIRMGGSALLFLGGLVGFYYFSDLPMVARVGIILLGVALAPALSWTTVPGTALRSFVSESVDETKKVAWPSRKESIQTAAIVFAFVVVMALFLWITDKLLEWSLYDLVLGWSRK